MKLSDLTKAQNPVTGQKFNVLDVKTWLPILVGMVALFVLYKFSSKWGDQLANKISGVVPQTAQEGFTDF